MQVKGEFGVLTTDTAILLHYIAMDIWTDCSVVLGRVEIGVLSEVTAVLLLHSPMDTLDDGIVVSTGSRRNRGSASNYCSTDTLYFYGYMD